MGIRSSAVRDLAFGRALAAAAERMAGAPDLPALWRAVVNESEAMIDSDTTALVERMGKGWRILAAQPNAQRLAAASRTDDMTVLAVDGVFARVGLLSDLSGDRWAAEAGWRSSLVLEVRGPVRRRPMRLGWFGRRPKAFEAFEDVAALFVRHVDLAVRTVVTRQSLQQATSVRHRIGLAQGILMARHQWSAEEAFEALQRRSLHRMEKLPDFAEQVVAGGDLVDAPSGSSTPHPSASSPDSCGVCEAYGSGQVGASADQATSGCLVWRCPICDRVWPRYVEGDRGRLAAALSLRLNRGRPPLAPSEPVG